MKHFLGLATLLFVGVLAWRIGEKLSTDAVSMAIGVLFGVLAGLPAALLVLAVGRRREPEAGVRQTQSFPMFGRGPLYQPPVIYLTGQAPSHSLPAADSVHFGRGESHAWPGAHPVREFRVVGEREEWIDEW